MDKFTTGPWLRADYTVYALNSAGRNIFDCQVQDVFTDDDELLANAQLIAAAPDLLEAQTMGASLNTPDFLDWIADRLVNVYGENERIDFVLSLRSRAAAGRAAITKATGEAK